jgi:peptidyl-prolyl cis-trans isomerase B (cyclophilin B)
VPAPAARSGEQEPMPSLRLDPSRTYTVSLLTNCGPIEIELDVAQAPRTTASFAWLVQRGFYDDLTFHRVVPGFVIQGGDPNGNGTGGPGYQVVEPPPASLQYTQGIVAMAKTPADPSGTSGSQFFIVTGANANLPPQYALVGRVVAGADTVQAISRIPTAVGADGEQSSPSRPIVIEKATLSS